MVFAYHYQCKVITNSENDDLAKKFYEILETKFPHKHFLVGIGNSLNTANDFSAQTGLRVLKRGRQRLFANVFKLTTRDYYYGRIVSVIFFH